MVVGQDLGITLDMERGWLRATAKGIVQITDLVTLGLEDAAADAAAPPDGRDRRGPPIGWSSPCRPTRPSPSTSSCEAAGVGVARVGDCVVPRRAHAAVIEGDRVGTAVG